MIPSLPGYFFFAGAFVAYLRATSAAAGFTMCVVGA